MVMGTNELSVVHLIDDDEGVREALTILLAESGFLVRAYKSGLDFLAAQPSGLSGCIVSDVRMPGLDGLELQRRLKDVNSSLPLIFITGHGDIQMAVQAMRQGAVDFIEKPLDDHILIDSVNMALRNKGTPPELSGEIQARLASLTPREREVLERLVMGKMNKITAHELEMSIRTVETHRARIMQKMQARSLSELVRFVLVAT